jgi:hypothetical protein
VPLPRLPQLNRIGSDKRGMQKAKDKLTLVQSENSDPALSTPSISDFTDASGISSREMIVLRVGSFGDKPSSVDTF